MENKKPVINPLKNGPLQVKNLVKFTNSRNEAIETKITMALCRCGASKNKPFCDGSHAKIGFTDRKSKNRVPDKKESYQGKKITIHDNRGICSHAGFCTDNLPGVFRMGTEPWIDPEGADIEEIKRIIKMCPSGALSYSENEKETKEFFEEAEIVISKNGPYYIRGGVKIENTNLGDDASPEHYTLCRCGHSGNKPRCDGAHWYAAFKDDEAKTISAAARKRQNAEPEWVKVAQINELQNGQNKKLSIHSQQILLSRIDDKYGAIDGICSHQGGPIIDAKIEDNIIRCPWHGHPFDPISGKSLGQDADLKSFEVEERTDGIYIKIAPPVKSAWTVSHLIAETAVNWGVKHVFGMVGHSNLGMAEAFRVQEEKGNLQYIGIRHEGAAAFAASAYSKISGKPAICFSIAGPGATNLLTGLWDAHVDRTPVLAITGQVNTQFFGPGSFQEIDLHEAFQAVAPFSKIVLPDSKHAELTSLALKNAIVNRNVSHLIVPDDVQTLDAGNTAPGEPTGRLADTRITPAQDAVNLAMYRIWQTKRPAIIVGYGARNNIDEIIRFAEKLRSPVLTTFKAKGQIPDYHPLSVGVLGKSGTPLSAHYMNTADLLIVFGASFSQHTGIDKYKPIIQVDNEQMALAKFHPVDNPIWGDVGITANLFSEKLADYSLSQIKEEQIQARKQAWREKKAEMARETNKKGINSVFIFNKLSEILPENAIIALDVGNNTYSFGRYFECKNQRVLLSGYLGSIGFGFPAAMGAYFAMPGNPIISISGDGGFGQYMAEFNTAVLCKMNITHILLNNNELGKISKEQRDVKMPVWQTQLNNPNFAEYANQCGGLGIRVTKNDELAEAVNKALSYQGPALVEIITDPVLT
ncbi:MAG: thiamine pyrophosphate-binding protein [Bacteroidales bacterium]|nr:thiamine pyrophosphate-binding protein [Bacteroidales bacterium]